MDVGVTFVLVRVDVGGSIAKEMASDKFSTTYTFQAYATPKKRTLQPHSVNTGFTLTDAGNTVATQYQSKMQHLAGDSFISDIKYGAQLLVNLKVEYLNEQHKSDISGRLGVSYGIGPIGISVEGELRFIDEKIKQSVKITVQALQKGGDPKQLLKIIPDNIITCTLDNYEPCFDLFVEASNYAREEFGSQLNYLADYNVVSYTAKPYSRSSLEVRKLDAGSQEITLGTTYRSLWLNNAFKTSIGHEHRAKALLTKYNGFLTAQELANANHIKQSAYSNGLVYRQYATQCQDNPYGSACEDSWNAYLANCGSGNYPACIVNYSEGDLNVTSDDISKYFKCETARQAAASFGVETIENSLAIRELSLAPVFVDPSDPAAGVINWLPCKLALDTYGSAFD